MTERYVAPLEPTAAVLGGDAPARTLKRLWLATRPQFLTASVLPVLVGTAWGSAMSGRFDVIALLLAVAATACVHAASNVLNDVGDELGGSDAINDGRVYPFTGGSRFIQNGVMSVREMTRWGITLLGFSMLLGIALYLRAGPGVLGFGIAGIALGLAYSLPPLQLSGRGVGELAIAVAFGALPVSGAAWLQSGMLDAQTLLLSLPVGMWVAAILLINEVPDIDADTRAHKRTLPVALGARVTRWVYLMLHLVALGGIAALVAGGALPVGSAAGVLVLTAIAVRASAGIAATSGDARERLIASIRTTLMIHALGCLWLLACIVFVAFTGQGAAG